MPWWPWHSDNNRSSVKNDLGALQDDLAESRLNDARDRISTSATAAYEEVKNEIRDIRVSQRWFNPQTALSFTFGAATALVVRWTAVRYLRRIRNVDYIKPELLRRKSDLGPFKRWSSTGFVKRRKLLGKVTSVGDGDNFHFFHTPGGLLAGWSWARKIPTERNALKGETIHIRMAGVDAPELAHFGRPAQPFGEEALSWLRNYILGRRVRVELHRRDQYDRVVGTAWVHRGIFRRDVSLEMLKSGLATVYEGTFGVEFGGFEKEYRNAEKQAKDRKVGMWTQPGLLKRLMTGGKDSILETPREYKTRMSAQEKDGENPAGTGKKS